MNHFHASHIPIRKIYFPSANKTIKGHISQTLQGVRSTISKFKIKPKSKPAEPTTSSNELQPLSSFQSKEIHIWVDSIRKLYIHDTGRFPIQSWGGNQYIMIAFHWNSNTILQAPFKTKNDRHQIEAYNSIMIELKVCGNKSGLYILNKKSSDVYK